MSVNMDRFQDGNARLTRVGAPPLPPPPSRSTGLAEAPGSGNPADCCSARPTERSTSARTPAGNAASAAGSSSPALYGTAQAAPASCPCVPTQTAANPRWTLLLTRRARNALGTATQCTRRNDPPAASAPASSCSAAVELHTIQPWECTCPAGWLRLRRCRPGRRR
jgi:hypothetical protein